MANTVFKLRRSSVAGKVPNTSTLSIGELAINLTDRILYSSEGSNVFEIGSNNTTVNVTNSLSVATNSIVNSSGVYTTIVNAVSFGIGTNAFVANSSGVYTNNHINLTRNDTRISFSPKAGGSNVFFIQQNDDNFVFYSTDTSNSPRPVWSIYANSTTSNINFSVPINLNGNIGLGSVALYANGSPGISGYVLASNGSATYWTPAGVGSVTQINTANGLIGGPITTNGTIYVLSNTGIVSNTSGLFVNSSYIATLDANNATTVGGNTSSDLRSYSNLIAANAYSNSVSYVDGKILTANAAITGNAATAYSNSVSYIDSKIATANAAITGNAATAYSNAIAFASNASNINTGTLAEARLPYRMNQNVTTSNDVTFGSLILTGNLTVSGNVTVIGANNLSIVDNMIYLNSNNTIDNEDLGIVGNYNTTGNSLGYAHTGIFRDASDGYWKVFDGYKPEPDANVNIDTTNTSFQLANFQANLYAAGNTSTNWFVANTSGAFHTGTINAASHTVGASFTANSTMTNTVSLVVSTNTATIGTGSYFVSNGNVGIGTATPGYKLEVNGETRILNNRFASGSIEVNSLGSGNRYALIDFIGDDTYTDYGLRIIRDNIGANSGSEIAHRGTGLLRLKTVEAAPITFLTNNTEQMRIASDGTISVGTSSTGSISMFFSGNAPAVAAARTLQAAQIISSSTTTNFINIASYPSVANATFTLPNLYHFLAGQATYGAAATITSQSGYYVASSLTGATNNFGFRSDIASGTGRWNVYIAGTADNYFAGNVGIGTTTPQSLLHVGAANTTYTKAGHAATFRSETGSDKPTVVIETGSDGSATDESGLVVFQRGSSFAGDNSVVDIVARSTAGESLRCSTSTDSGVTKTVLFQVQNDGNVGIGNSAPTHKLSVNGGALVNTHVSVGNSTVNSVTNATSLYFNSTTSAVSVIAKPTSNSSQNYRFDIGPLGGNNAVYGSPFWSGANFASPVITLANSSLAYPRTSLYYNYTNTTAPTDMYFNIVAGNDSGLGTGIRLYASGTDTVNRGIDIAANGNVGIGTSSPANLLDVAGMIRMNSATQYNGITFQNGTYEFAKLYGQSATNDNGVLSLNLAGTTNVLLRASGTNYINGGNLGIGTNSPAQKLHVVGNARIGGSTSSNYSTLAVVGDVSIQQASPLLNFVSADGATRFGYLYHTGSGGNVVLLNQQNGVMTFGTNNTERMRIAADGLVGVGTSAPVSRLQVGAKVTDDASYTYDTNTLMAVHQTATGTSVLNDPKPVLMLARQGAAGQAFGAAAQFNLSRYENAGGSNVGSRTRLDFTLAHDTFMSSNTIVMTMLSSGNVGIGTTSPTSKLVVSGADNTVLAYFSGVSKAVRFVSSSGGSSVEGVDNTGVASYQPLTVGGSTVSFHTGGTGRMSIDASGNVLPGADNTYNLGSLSLRWANIFTGDLHLSNENSNGNDIDKTTGNWTIQEGETDLYIINNKNGKKFKFKLEEIQ